MVKDHTGREFKSKKEMCGYWNIKKCTYEARINRGMTIKKALTSSVERGKKCRDHLGKEFNSIVEMCEYWGIEVGVYEQRRRKGNGLEYALTYKKRKHSKECADHTGKKYRTITDMCKHWGINRDTYMSRIEIGKSIEEALTEKADFATNCYACEDHIGNRFNSNIDMLRYWDVAWTTYTARIGRGNKLDEALGCRGSGLRYRAGKRFGEIDIIKFSHTGFNNIEYFKCIEDGVEKMMRGEDIVQRYLEYKERERESKKGD